MAEHDDSRRPGRPGPDDRGFDDADLDDPLVRSFLQSLAGPPVDVEADLVALHARTGRRRPWIVPILAGVAAAAAAVTAFAVTRPEESLSIDPAATAPEVVSTPVTEPEAGEGTSTTTSSTTSPTTAPVTTATTLAPASPGPTVAPGGSGGTGATTPARAAPGSAPATPPSQGTSPATSLPGGSGTTAPGGTTPDPEPTPGSCTAVTPGGSARFDWDGTRVSATVTVVTPGFTPETSYPKATRAEVRFDDSGSQEYKARGDAEDGTLVCTTE